MLDKKTFHEYLEYKDGKLFWKTSKMGRKNGNEAGKPDKNGYGALCINYRKYLTHRVIWVMFNGDIPPGMQIDHKDNNPFNHCIENLRIATCAQNVRNKVVCKNNVSGFKGVSYGKSTKAWRADIFSKGVHYFLGYYKTAEIAHEAYKNAALQHHKEFANFG